MLNLAGFEFTFEWIVFMIHIATVHWETDKWIDIQLKYLNRYIKQPFRVYAFLSGSAAIHRDKFFFASTEPIQSHAVKLNILGEIICHEAESDEDILIFIDGDAFPVADTENAFAVWLKDSPLAAVQRLENVGDIQPHPSFCITTVGFWRKINGDWKEGYEWKSSAGMMRTDVGGNLLDIMGKGNYEWGKIYRSMNLTAHPVLCGIYGGIVYHHASGFRRPLSQYDRMKTLVDVIQNRKISRLVDLGSGYLSLKNRFRLHRLLGLDRKMVEQNTEMADTVFKVIVENDYGLERLFKGGS